LFIINSGEIMNIFAIEGTSSRIDWKKSARSLDNYRVVKMILESCQMLCTTLNLLYDDKVTPYRNAHKNHPSTKWVRESSANFLCLVEHTEAMIAEYKERFTGKTHKCEAVLEKCVKLFRPELFPSNKGTPLPLCMPDEFKTDKIVESYRNFYAAKPRMRYPEAKIPPWFRQCRGNKEFQIV